VGLSVENTVGIEVRAILEDKKALEQKRLGSSFRIGR
jgi:hypothetical protein